MILDLIVTERPRTAKKVNEVDYGEYPVTAILLISDLLLGLVFSMLWSIAEISEASRHSITWRSEGVKR